MSEVFIIQDIWNTKYDTYCVDCRWRQTHLSYVPEGETYADYTLETCVPLNDPSIPETECTAHADFLTGDKDD